VSEIWTCEGGAAGDENVKADRLARIIYVAVQQWAPVMNSRSHGKRNELDMDGIT
jgi:hypothetical protein